VFLSVAELTEKYYTPSEPLTDPDKNLYLLRANAFCRGFIGGDPPTIDDGLKIAVALCFEVFARGETSQIDEATGNITDVAPPTAATMHSNRYMTADQSKTVKEMLRPYKLAFENSTNVSDRGVKFL
jgi:hypothetical protein